MNNELSGKLENQKPLIRDQLVWYIIEGTNKSQWNKIKAMADVEFVGHYFSSMLVVPSGTSPANSFKNYKLHMRNLAEEFSSHELLILGIELVDREGIACIINTRAKNDFHLLLEGLASRIQRKVEEEMGFQATVGVGRIYNNVELVHKSFVEAHAALDCRLIDGKKGIIFFDDIARLPESFRTANYPLEEEAILIQGIKQGDTQIVLEVIDRVIHYIKQENTQKYMVKCIAFDIINSVIKTAGSMAIDEEKLRESQRSVVLAVETGSLDELREKLYQLCRTICEMVNEKKESRNEKLCTDIVQYIKNHYKRYTLSVEEIADAFSLSRAYLSRFFKEHTGETPTDFINRLRMDSIRLLANTDKPVKILSVKSVIWIMQALQENSSVKGITPGQ